MFLNAGDTINGTQGEVLINVNGNIINAGWISKITATATKQKKEIKVLGLRESQYKANGWTGEGSATIHDVTSVFRRMMIDYVKTGKDAYFDILTTVDDPNSNAGAERMRLGKCNINSCDLVNLDANAEELETDIDFTFSEADMLEEHKNVLA